MVIINARVRKIRLLKRFFSSCASFQNRLIPLIKAINLYSYRKVHLNITQRFASVLAFGDVGPAYLSITNTAAL